jgi:hypothetical protein
MQIFLMPLRAANTRPPVCQIKFAEAEDIRYVYLYLRIELLLKGMMCFLALSNQEHEVLALTFLIGGSVTIALTVRLMRPSNLGHVNRLKYLIHGCSIWMCLSCIWSISVDNKSWGWHLGVVLLGWFFFFAAHTVSEIGVSRKDILKQGADDAVVAECSRRMEVLQDKIITGRYVCGKRVSWTTHSHILKLLNFAKHERVRISSKSFETLAVLSYLDQMTQKDSFFAYSVRSVPLASHWRLGAHWENLTVFC